MAHKLKTAPTEEPVSLQEIRQQLGISDISDTSRDAIISTRITSARRWSEQHTRRAFVTQTWIYYAPCFADYFDLKADLQSVVSVKYIDPAGVLQTLAPADYLVDTVSSRLYPAYNTPWPAIRLQPNAIQIEYISGYGLAVDVPEEIKSAIKFTVGHWENYQNSIEGAQLIRTIPYAVTQLLSPHVDMRSLF